jgi:hypothetical protein
MNYRKTTIAKLKATALAWDARWQKEPYPGSDCVSLEPTLLAKNDGSTDAFPTEALGLWVYLDKDGAYEFFKTEKGAKAYIRSEDESDKVEI